LGKVQCLQFDFKIFSDSLHDATPLAPLSRSIKKAV
jgi:hypothetical protein